MAPTLPRLLLPARSGTSPRALLQHCPRPGLGRVRSAAPVHTSALRHVVGIQKEHLGFGGQAHHEEVGMRRRRSTPATLTWRRTRRPSVPPKVPLNEQLELDKGCSKNKLPKSKCPKSLFFQCFGTHSGCPQGMIFHDDQLV
ncbi:uncharacterized protein LOC119276948 isoform X2 [Triticum dicoccoides]|uniref:uncharacterized protein LOC119276948 isoform X2 n=1 Tax=Triticum dicoccoides TaxID=85692 RepID=UPI00188F59E4|nr:uncharacterized protein LOC119276948 isoform X2 [Triticum dicoccoides]XP_037414030.1 uncharacterized protein LOC119276948 isoform X2 [Triticum dicoccoides]